MKVCSICGKKFSEWGNNPRPFSRNLCCDECNKNVILPLRMFENGMIEKGLLIKPGDTPLSIEYVDLRNFKDIQTYVGTTKNPAFVTRYPIKHFEDLTFFVDEEGELKHLKPNELAFELYRIQVVGNLLIVPSSLDRIWR